MRPGRALPSIDSNCRPIIVASHPRSGTHLLIDSLRLNMIECRSWKWPLERLDRLYFGLDNFLDSSGRVDYPSASALRRSPRPLIKTHAASDLTTNCVAPAHVPAPNPSLIRFLNSRASVVYIYRDGREALASWHQLSQQLDPSAHVPLGEFIRQEVGGVSRVRQWAQHVNDWSNCSQAYFVSMEELIIDPFTILRGIADWCGLTMRSEIPRLPRRLRNVAHSRMCRIFATHPQSTAILARRRHEDWRIALSKSDRRFFHDEAGDLLIRLGYEDSDEWVNCNANYQRGFTASYFSAVNFGAVKPAQRD